MFLYLLKFVFSKKAIKIGQSGSAISAGFAFTRLSGELLQSITCLRVFLGLYFYFESTFFYEFVTLKRFDKLKITWFTNTIETEQ